MWSKLSHYRGEYVVEFGGGGTVSAGKFWTNIKQFSSSIFSLSLLSGIAFSTSFESSLSQETLNVPSYYSSGQTSNTTQTSTTSEQQQSLQNYQNLISNIQINQGLISQLSESSEVVANPSTGEIVTVGTNDPTPDGWVRLDVTQTSNGYTLGSNDGGGQFNYNIQSQPTQTYQTAAAQQTSPTVNYTPTTTVAGAQTTTTNSTQTSVGNTSVQVQNDGTTVTSTPTETVDTQVTTIVTPDSETVITETTTTTVTETLIEGPVVVVEGGSGATYATQAQQAQQATQATQAQQATGYVSPYTPSNPYTAQTTGTTSTSSGTTGSSSPAITTPTVTTGGTISPTTTTGQTSVTTDSQTTVGDTTSTVLDDGSTLTTTPTETVDTTVTVIEAPNSTTTITETLTTTVIDGTLETPGTGTSSGSGTSSGTAVTTGTDTGTTAVKVSDPVTTITTTDSSTSEPSVNTSSDAVTVTTDANETDGGGVDIVDSGEDSDAGSDVNVADASDEENEGTSSEDDGNTEDTASDEQTSETSAPASVVANNAASSSGMSQAEREAAAARAAEEERRRREEYIRMQQEASNLRQGAQNRAMQLLEDESPAMASNGTMMNSGDMADPQRLSIYNQNMRLRSEGGSPNVSGQIASLSNSVSTAIGNEDDILGGMAGFGPCPPILANACDEAANRVADEIEDAVDKARDQAEDDVEEDLDDLDEEIDEAQENAENEKERRDNRSRRERLRDQLEEEQRERAERLEEEGRDLEERADEQQERRERLEQEERDLRRQEQEARRNGDPNCRGAECRSIREQRQQNSRDITDLAREEGMLQRDQARFQGQVREFQQAQEEIDRLYQGDPVWEAQQAQAGAHDRARDAQSEVDRLREQQLDLRRQGGSGSRQDQALDRAIEQAERVADAAAREAAAADMTVLQAQFYENGMQDEWREYENARRAGDAYNNFLNADQQMRDLFDQRNSVEDTLRAARENPDFDPDSLRSLEEELADLNRQFNAADEARIDMQNALGDFGNYFGDGSTPPTNDNVRALSDTLNDISSQFSERQRLQTLTDVELNAEIEMLNEAEQRVAAARNGIGGDVQDPGGIYTDRYNALQGQRDQLQDQIDNFNPTGVDGRPIIGADQAYRDLQNQLNDVNQEIDSMQPIAAADSAFARVEGYNDWSDSLLEGFPLDAQGNIDRVAFSEQIADMAQNQINLVEANNNLEQARADLEQAQSTGDQAAIDRAQSRVDQYGTVVGRITNQFELNDVNVLVEEDGGFAVDTENIGASATWSAAAQGVSQYIADSINQERQLAAAGGGTVPGPTTDVPADTEVAAPTTPRVGEGTVLREVTEPLIVTEPPVSTPGGYVGSVIEAANTVADQATKSAATIAASNNKPSPTVAELAEATRLKQQEIRESQSRASSVARDIDSAEFDAEMAENEAEFRRQLADDNIGTRERQAGEYIDLADSATEQAEEQRDRAAELDEQARRLRESAERNQRLASTTDDRSLARDAQQAAENNIEDAEEREAEAERIRAEASRDDERASRLAEAGETVQEDVEQLAQDAEQAEADAARAQEDLERLRAEEARLNAETERLRQEATQTANQLARIQQQAFNELMTNPPDGWRWSELDSDQRSAWLNENIPQWDSLSIEQRQDYLYRLELGEAVNDLKTQQAEYDAFNESPQGQRSTTEMLESRIVGLQNMEARIKELNEMDDLTPEQEAEKTRLQDGLERGTLRLRADQTERARQEQARFDAIQAANRGVWNVDSEQRAAEVQRHVDSYASLLNRLDDARSIQTARAEAFDTRAAEIQNRIDNPTSAEDAEAAKGEMERLNQARNYWTQFDANTVSGTEQIAEEARHQISYYGTMNGLGELAFENELEGRAAATQLAGAVNGTYVPVDTSAVSNAIANLDLTEPDPTVWESMISGYDTVTGAVSDAAVTAGAVAGTVWGTGEGIFNAAVGLVDIVVIQSLDTYYEALQMNFNEITGLDIDIVGTENLDAINSALDGSPSNLGSLALDFVILQGGKVSNGVDKVQNAYLTGSVSDSFSGASDVAEVGAELFIDPTLIAGGIFKGINILRAVNAVDEVAQIANVADDALRVGSTVGDAVGDSLRLGDAAHTPLVNQGAYQGLDELLGPEFANAFGEVPRAPVYPAPRPTPIPAGGTRTPTTPLAPVDGPYVGLDELLGPEFANAFDNVPGAGALDGPTPYQGLDELLGPEFANAFGEVPRAPVYPPVRPSQLPSGPAPTPSTPAAALDGPYQGLDELLGPEFTNAFDNYPGAGALDGPTPYQGLDELLGPEFANAFGTTPRPQVYPPVSPAPLPAGGVRPPAAPLPTGPYQGLDELLGPAFRNALDDATPFGGTTGPSRVPFDNPPGVTGPTGAGGGAGIPPTQPGAALTPPPGSGSGIPPTVRPGGTPSTVPSVNRPPAPQPATNLPLTPGETGIPVAANDLTGAGNVADNIPPTVRPGNAPSTVPSANRPPAPQPASNVPLTPGESGIPVAANDLAGAGNVADNIPPTVRPGNAPSTVPSVNRPPAPQPASNVPLTPGESGIPVAANDVVSPSRLARAEAGTLPPGGATPPGNPAAGAADLGPGGTLRDEFVQGSGRPVVVPDNPATPVTARRHTLGDTEFTYLTDPATGTVHKLEKGTTLGRGTFTEVSTLRNQPRPSVVKEAVSVEDMARLTDDVDEAVRLGKVGDRLDNVGTDAIRQLDEFVQQNVVYTPEVIDEFKVVANNADPNLAGKTFRVTELAPSPTYADEMRALGQSWSTPMNPEQANALARAQNFINESGHVILDFKSNNFGFQRLENGNLRVIVHDAGGVVPVRGATAAEKAANAKLLQRVLLTPDEASAARYQELLQESEAALSAERSARQAGDDLAASLARDERLAANAERAEISFGHRDAVLRDYGHLIDTDLLQVPLDEIAFNPTIGFAQDQVRATARANMQRAANDNFAALEAAAGGN